MLTINEIRNFNNDDLVKLAEQLIIEAERRVIDGDIHRLDISGKYSHQGINWSHSSARCHGPYSWDESDLDWTASTETWRLSND